VLTRVSLRHHHVFAYLIHLVTSSERFYDESEKHETERLLSMLKLSQSGCKFCSENHPKHTLPTFVMQPGRGKPSNSDRFIIDCGLRATTCPGEYRFVRMEILFGLPQRVMFQHALAFVDSIGNKNTPLRFWGTHTVWTWSPSLLARVPSVSSHCDGFP
jgi:hypothetical protein